MYELKGTTKLAHVLPINDAQPHHECESCPCNPVVEEYDCGARLIIHNTFDGRDIEEERKQCTN